MDWQRKGFLEKQFTSKEQTIILAAENPFEMVWLFWSMKESAYKVWVQQYEKQKFSPLQFECKLTSTDDGIVFHQSETYYTTSIIDGYYIFTIATLEKEDKVFSQIGSPHQLEVNLKKKLEELTGYSASEIEKKKTETGVPNYYHENKQIMIPCSISHHGNYGAFSLFGI